MNQQEEDFGLDPDKPAEQNPENVEPNLNPEPEMEVHHHTHESHGKKTWKNYFWEFLMLFLAVFCGFLAEYQLEHKIERDRAKDLAKSFYEELRNDSIYAQVKVENRLKQEAALKYLIRFFRDSSLTNVSKTFTIHFQYGISFRSPAQFEPRTTILDQLKHSGSLRYFRNEELQKLTGDLTVAIRNIYDRQALESQNRLERINPIIIDHYDYEFNEKMMELGKGNIFDGVSAYEKSDLVIPYHVNGIQDVNRKKIVNNLNFYTGNIVSATRSVHIQKYIEINAALLKVIRDEYHFK